MKDTTPIKLHRPPAIPINHKCHGLPGVVVPCATNMVPPQSFSVQRTRLTGATRGSEPSILSAALIQDRTHDGHHSIPLRLLGSQLTPAGRCDCVEARFTVVVCYAPGAAHQAPL